MKYSIKEIVIKNIINFRNNRIIKNIKNRKHIEKYIENTDKNIRILVAEHGTDDDRMTLSIDDTEESVRAAIVVFGNDIDRKHLRRDKSPLVRKTLAKHGTDDDRTFLENDNDEGVREEVKRVKDLIVLSNDNETNVSKRCIRMLD